MAWHTKHPIHTLATKERAVDPSAPTNGEHFGELGGHPGIENRTTVGLQMPGLRGVGGSLQGIGGAPGSEDLLCIVESLDDRSVTLFA